MRCLDSGQCLQGLSEMRTIHRIPVKPGERWETVSGLFSFFTVRAREAGVGLLHGALPHPIGSEEIQALGVSARQMLIHMAQIPSTQA